MGVKGSAAYKQPIKKATGRLTSGGKKDIAQNRLAETGRKINTKVEQ